MNPDTKKHIIEAIETHKKMTADFEKDGLETVAAIAEAITISLRQGGTVYLCGNGGSAADAQHIAGEFVGRFNAERKALAAVAFSTDTSVLTCIAN
ncbi:MAG: SIS domain-containing protein, partial [Planctomycetota bacterium]